MKWLLLFLLTGCASTEAHRFIDDWQEARADGEIDEADMRILDNDAEALDEAMRAPPIPHTGVPWLDGGIALATVAASVMTTNKLRDRKRRKRGEPVGEKVA